MLCYGGLIVLFFALTVPLILKPGIGTFGAKDEIRFHYPTILTFAEQFPQPDLIHYPSATTPLYHLFMACFAFLFGPGILSLRLISSLFSLAALLLIHHFLAGRGDRRKALYFTVLLMFSPYFIGPAIRLSTDNGALLFAVLSIYMLETASPGMGRNFLVNLTILVTVLIRQLYAWLIGAFLIFGWFRTPSCSAGDKLRSVLLPVLLPVTGLGAFILLWQGLTPPRFSAEHAAFSLNPEALVYMVSLVGAYGIFFGLWLFRLHNRRAARIYPILILIAVAAGYIFLCPVSNAYSAELGERGGALWLAASLLPNILSGSVLFLVLFPVGIVFLYILGRYLIARQDILIILCFLLWFLANMTNHKTFQKYYDPFILFAMGYTLCTLRIKEKWTDWIGPAVLLAGFAGVSVFRFYY